MPRYERQSSGMFMFSAWHEEGLDLVTEVFVKSRCLVRKGE
jgi:hypothetical protein